MRKLLYIIGLILLVVFGYLLVEYWTYSNSRDHQVETLGQETTEALRDEIDGILSRIATEAKTVAEALSTEGLSTERVESIIKESALSIKEIQGVTACYEPYGLSVERELYCPYYNKGTQDYLLVEESYDYTDKSDPSTAWYTGVRDEGAKWVEPYFAKGAQDWYVDYGIPFYYNSGPNKGKVKGTVTMSFVASGFKKLVHNMSLGKTGYGIITSTEGSFLAHPVNEYIGTTRLDSIRSLVQEPELAEAYGQLLAGKSGKVEYTDALRSEPTYFYYDQIPSANWGLGLVFYKNDLIDDHKALDHRYIRLALVLSLLLVCVLAIFYNKDYLDAGEIWKLSIISSLLLLANIVLIGYLEHSTLRPQTESESPPITDVSSLDRFIGKHHDRSNNLRSEKVRPIPTGLYIERMEFQDSYNLNLSGRVWQKYPLEIAEQVTQGFQFPQMSPFAEASYIEESYRDTIASREDADPYLLIGYEFRVTLLLNFDYSDYPLDKRHIDLQLDPLDRGDHLVFVPDLQSYSYTNPSRKSGLDPRIRISGSEVLESYFNFSTETYDSDFGYDNKGLYEEVPRLHFNINLRRVLINDFVTYLIPIGVSLLMMFILIYACGKTDERQGIIESMAAFFFVLIFSHIDLRKEIVTADLIYIEYFYFATYVMIVLSTWNLITYSKNKSAIFDFNENQLYKASYFPIFLLMILAVTLAKFF